MKINAALKIAITVFAIIIFSIDFVLFFGSRDEARTIEKGKIIEELIIRTAEHHTLTTAYLLNHEEQTIERWHTKHVQLDDLLLDATKKFEKSEEQSILYSIKQSNDSGESIFSQLIAEHEMPPPLIHEPTVMERELATQLLLKSEAIILDAIRLSNLVRTDMAAIRARLLAGFVASLSVFLVITAGIFLFIDRRIIRRLTKFQEGTKIFSEGNLDFRLPVSRPDEIGELAASFNEMATKLKRSYQELKERIVSYEETKSALLNVFEDLDLARVRIEHEQARDKALLESIGDGLIATDTEGNVASMNRAAQEMLGWKIEDALGKKIYDVLPAEDEHGKLIAPKNRSIMRALWLGEKVSIAPTTAHYFIRKDGKKIPTSITATPIILDKEIIGSIDLFRDITKEKELDKAKSDFIATASHQLRTPLVGIQWVVERLVKKERLTDTGKEYVSDIHSSAERLSKLVDLLLNVSRIESGVRISPKEIEVMNFIDERIKEFQPVLSKKDLKLEFERHPVSLPIISDASALHVIVDSIISNAIEYTPAGGTITVSVKKAERGVVLTVRDTGIGIPKSEQADIFQKFARASNAKLVKTDGTGLGLYIAAESIRLLGGRIWFESEENKGSTFFVELPLKSEPVEGTKTLS